MNKVTKGNLYQNILDAYNIIPSGYAIKYLTPDLSEASLMNIIFSKFTSDTTYNTDNAFYIEYILKSKYVASYDMASLVQNTHYYEDGMSMTDKRDQVKSNPSSNTNILDFDISLYASAHISSYLFYLDIISEIYGAAYDLKKAKQSIIANQMTLKCRYYYSADNQLLYTLNNTGYFNITLGITREGIDNQVSNVEVLSPHPLQVIFKKFNEDIKNHLTFLNGNDVTHADAKYLLEVKYFYMTCRLKLMYFIANSLRIFTSKESATASSNTIVTSYIIQYILPVFINYKTKALSLETDITLSKKNVEYANTVLDTTNKLKKINENIARGKAKLLKNQKTRNSLQQYIDKKKIINVFAYVILIFVIIASIILTTTNIGRNSKATLSAILTAVVLLAYVIIFSLTQAIEKFQVGTLDPTYSSDLMVPRLPIASNFDLNKFFTITRTTGSSSYNDDNSYWKAFDGIDTTGWKSAKNSYDNEGKALNTYKNDYAGEYLMIDTGLNISISEIKLKCNSKESAPKSFKIYASNSIEAYQNVNHNSWVLLSESNDVTYDDNLEKTFSKQNVPVYDIKKALREAFIKNAVEQKIALDENAAISLINNKDAETLLNKHASGYKIGGEDTYFWRLPIQGLGLKDVLLRKGDYDNIIKAKNYNNELIERLKDVNRFYMIIVNKISPNQDVVAINKLSFIINPENVKTVDITSIKKNNYELILPYDYDDNYLVSWDLGIKDVSSESKYDSYVGAYGNWGNSTTYTFEYVIKGVYSYMPTSQIDTTHCCIQGIHVSYNKGYKGFDTMIYNIKSKLDPDNIRKLKITMKGSAKTIITIRYYSSVLYSEKKDLIINEMANSGAIDKEALAKAMLDQANADYNKALADITKANNEFNTAKANLEKAIDDKEAKLALENAEFQRQLATANEAKTAAERDASQKLADATKKEADAERERLRLESETTAKTTAQQRVTELTTLNNNAMDAFQAYMTAAEKTQYAQARSENANLAYQIAFDTSTRAIASAQAQADVENAKSVSGYAELVAKKKAAEEATAKANADHAQSVKNHAFNLQLINQIVNIERIDLQNQIAYQTEQLRLANEASAQAENDLQTVQNQISLFVGQINTEYSFNSSNIDQTTTDLRLRLLQEQKQKADADAEYATQQLEELRQKELEATANTAIDENNRLIIEKNNSINFYRDELLKSQENLRLLQETNTNLRQQLIRKLETIGATAQIADANNRLTEMETRTRLKINELNIEKSQILIVYTNSVLQSELAAKDALIARTNKENLMKELESQIISKQQYQKDISDAKSAIEDYNISEILGDVDVHVLYSINDNMNSINNATVIPRLRREHQYYDQYNQAMKNYTFVTDSDRNIKTIDGKALDDGTLFIVQLAILIAVCCIIYHIASPYIAIFVGIGLFVVIVALYYINIMSNVRTKAENYYWHKPEESSDSV